MEDLETSQDILSIILGQDIRLISGTQTEKEYRVSPLAKSIRMDVFSISEKGVVYDIFGLGKYRYTFKAICEEYPQLSLDDGAVRIFLNSRGTNDGDVSPELVAFLHYMENTTDETALETGSERIQRIHQRVYRVKQSEEIGMKFMRELEENNMARAEGRKEGHEAGVADGILSSVRNLMETMNLSAEKAMDALKVSETDRGKYLKLLDKDK